MKEFDKKKLGISVLIGVIIGGTLAGLTAFAKVYAHGRFMPNTELAGIDISYQTPEEVKQSFQTKVDDFHKQPFTLTFQEENLEISPEELGIEIMLEQTLSTIKRVDGSQIGLTELVGLNSGGDFNLIIDLDEQKFNQTLEDNFQLSEISPKSASFAFDSGKLIITEAKPGITADTEELIQNLRDSARKLKTSNLTIAATESQPQITQEQLEAEKENMEQIINHKLTLIDPVYSDDWHVSLKDNLNWLQFTTEQELAVKDLLKSEKKSPQIKVAINQEQLNLFIDQEISEWLDKEAKNTEIYLDKSGEVIIEGTGQDGMKIQRNMMRESMELAFNNLVSEITIPVLKIPAELNISQELQEMGIKERISQGHTSYYGSPNNRVHNIKVGAERFNGQIIQPQEEFSFNTLLGPVDGSTGYRKELVIKPEGTIPEYGGGICQVSTTMYRAALNGGLDITDRRQHSYAVSYYSQIDGHGLDATIYLGGQDFKFKNDTEYPILIQTYIDDSYELYVNFYGTSDGRSVDLEGPFISNYRSPGATQYIETGDLAPGVTKQVEKAHTGFNADWKYTLTKGNGEVVTKTLNTSYKAVPAKILIGKENPALPESD